jgi:hypothetical protein
MTLEEFVESTNYKNICIYFNGAQRGNCKTIEIDPIELNKLTKEYDAIEVTIDLEEV